MEIVETATRFCQLQLSGSFQGFVKLCMQNVKGIFLLAD